MDDMRLESLEETVTDIQRTLYGNSKERNGGGLYGLVMKSSRRLDEVERRRPPSATNSWRRPISGLPG